MLTFDEAFAIGCRKYRELYPKGTIPADIEDAGVLGATPGDSSVTVHLAFWIAGEAEPFFIFRASVERTSGTAAVAYSTTLTSRIFSASRMDASSYLVFSSV